MPWFQNIELSSNPTGRQNLSNKIYPNPSELEEVTLIFRIYQSIYVFLTKPRISGKFIETLFNKKLIFTWSDDHIIVFKKKKSELVNLTDNTRFDVKLNDKSKIRRIT